MADPLLQREQHVLEQVVMGRSTKQIAHALQLSPRTVDAHRSNILHMMGARNAVDLVRKVSSVLESKNEAT